MLFGEKLAFSWIKLLLVDDSCGNFWLVLQVCIVCSKRLTVICSYVKKWVTLEITSPAETRWHKKKLLPVTCIYLKKRFGYKMEQTQNSRDLYMKCIFHVDIIEAFPGGLLV